ncbi:unnamed protein product [Soboliphyme baturini]|uniref:BRISC and BRCA1-A complex member 2 n=1 Tax=Soboliphyme baturini TaxID=241478 RepID=A0A183JAE8_9BILA|nr:unnamed protein product [Soboliphyme baturini]
MASDDEETEEVRLVPWLQRLVDTVLDYDGFRYTKARIWDIRTSELQVRYLDGPSKNGDRFGIALPYANHFLCARIAFVWIDENIRPEFYFDEEDFDPPLETLPEFLNWNPNDNTSLLRLLLAVRLCYKNYHVTLCRSIDLFRFHMDSLDKLMKDTKFVTPEDTDVFFYRRGASSGDAHFTMFIQLPNTAEIPKPMVPKVLFTCPNV